MNPSSNVVIAAALAILFLLLAWWRVHVVASRKAPISLALRLVLFGLAFVAGEIYLIVLFADLKWPRAVAFLAVVSWGVLLISGAGRRSLRQNGHSKGSKT